MRLQHLVLQGYKSFANKTEFEFPTGITAIVGPNGVGKSNIADAIRWALGERSMSTLRAKATADMIFAGGEGRARSGMAEVSLTFDNTDGGLPIEFSEVTISRRAYRSGENVYLINGSQVLLRDVEELLAESSLSERTYTVIGQGLVDAALALSPRDRRALFEEAAGISLYRDRREKTIERLDETERNLERVHDIVSEITPRLERLERDAKQVEQHRRLEAHVKRLQRTWYGYLWGQQQERLGRALERAANMEVWLNNLRSDASQLGEQLTEVRERESVLRGSLRDWYRESADLHETVDEARRKVAVSEERERLLRTRREELLGEIEPLSAQREEQARGVAELEAHIAELEQELAERRAELEQVEREARERDQQAERRAQARARVERELRDQRARLERLDRELLEAREARQRLLSGQAVAEERARLFESRREEAISQLEPLHTQEETQVQRVARERARLAELEQNLAQRRGELSDLEQAAASGTVEDGSGSRERAQVEQALREHRERVTRLDERLLETRNEVAELAGELRALERVQATGGAYDRGVQILREAQLDGVLGPLAALIQVEPAWERAIEAALGSDLQAVVVERASVVREAHGLLEAQGGRVTLLPLDVHHPPTSGGPVPGEALSAASLVTCEEPLRPAVEALLGPVALCEDLEEASAVLPRMPAGGRCVTRDGIVVRADGAFVVGTGEAGGVLGHERMRRELPPRLERARRRLGELEAQREAEAGEQATLEARLAEIDGLAAQARDEARKHSQERLANARMAVAVAEETLRGQRAALEREEGELARLCAQREGLQRQASALETQHAAEMEQARAFRLALSWAGSDTATAEGEASEGSPPVPALAQDPEVERFREQLWAAQSRCDEVEKRQRAASERISSLEERLEHLTQQVTAAREEAARFERERLSAAHTAVAVTEASLRSERQALERERALLERVRSQIDARRGRAEELKAERQRLLEHIAGLREDASRLAGELHEVRGRIQPAEDELEALDEAATALGKRRQGAQKRVRAAEERYGRAELQVERRRDELRMLSQRIEEDLGLVELELADSVTAQTPLPMRPLVSELPVVEQLPEGLEEEMQFVKKRLRALGGVNPNAPHELAEVQERHTFLTEQAADLRAATDKLRRTVSELDTLMEQAFKETFDAVAEGFSGMFSDLFEGGQARLELTDPDDLLNTGVEIVARPPGKRAQRLALLSGGERALTAVALLFSLLHISPTPFCVFDEVDAMLDEANVGRFRAKLEELSQGTQFIVITHNRATVESAGTVYGVSMGANAASQVVSLRMEEKGG